MLVAEDVHQIRSDYHGIYKRVSEDGVWWYWKGELGG